MGTLEHRWQHGMSRRKALAGLAGILAGSPLLGAQQDPRPLKDHTRVPGIDEMLTAFDFEPVCFANVPLALHDYTMQGSEGEFTLRRNRDVFDWVDLVERPGAAARAVNASTEVLGIKMDFPIMIAPTGNQGTQHLRARRRCTAARPPPVSR